MRAALWFAGVACTMLPLRAELVQRDLGQGLSYFRAHSLPVDLPPASAKTGPMVLDLRFTTAEEAANTALDAWLKFRATPTTPVFLLVNHETASSLREAVGLREPTSGVVLIGEPSAELKPDIAVPAAAKGEDRRAYDALEHGASVESLLVENADKPRIDEASIMRDRANPPSEFAEADPIDLHDSPPAKPDAAPAPVKESPVIDRPLQRAVQVHRALLALKRL